MIPPGPRVSVVLKTISRVSDGLGGYTNTLVSAATFKAVLTPVTGNENITYNKETVRGDYLLFSEQLAVTPKEADFIVYGTRTFRILFVNFPFNTTKFFVLDLVEVK